MATEVLQGYVKVAHSQFKRRLNLIGTYDNPLSLMGIMKVDRQLMPIVNGGTLLCNKLTMKLTKVDS